jgi:two-component system, cell cycle response regulator
MEQRALICLYADDHATFRSLMDHYMSALGIELTLAKDGDEAFELSLIKPYGLVFLDYEMPYMTGIEVAFHYRRHLRDQGQIPAPIILVTGRDRGFCEDHRSIGLIDFYLPKPFSVQDLILVIDHALSLGHKSPTQAKHL